uniref:Uncharacterized protein n=1 Tax=Pithovirus LCDPAC02 TaxID=2506601 RepID=A0A481YNY9_9VIRU|nr:MAG: hypothetical protein LCDPAC02_00480 [Pithovirus LCDPAC02]
MFNNLNQILFTKYSNIELITLNYLSNFKFKEQKYVNIGYLYNSLYFLDTSINIEDYNNLEILKRFSKLEDEFTFNNVYRKMYNEVSYELFVKLFKKNIRIQDLMKILRCNKFEYSVLDFIFNKVLLKWKKDKYLDFFELFSDEDDDIYLPSKYYLKFRSEFFNYEYSNVFMHTMFKIIDLIKSNSFNDMKVHEEKNENCFIELPFDILSRYINIDCIKIYSYNFDSNKDFILKYNGCNNKIIEYSIIQDYYSDLKFRKLEHNYKSRISKFENIINRYYGIDSKYINKFNSQLEFIKSYKNKLNFEIIFLICNLDILNDVIKLYFNKYQKPKFRMCMLNMEFIEYEKFQKLRKLEFDYESGYDFIFNMDYIKDVKSEYQC